LGEDIKALRVLDYPAGAPFIRLSDAQPVYDYTLVKVFCQANQTKNFVLGPGRLSLAERGQQNSE
jgi:hypothetical protein